MVVSGARQNNPVAVGDLVYGGSVVVGPSSSSRRPVFGPADGAWVLRTKINVEHALIYSRGVSRKFSWSLVRSNDIFRKMALYHTSHTSSTPSNRHVRIGGGKKGEAPVLVGGP